MLQYFFSPIGKSCRKGYIFWNTFFWAGSDAITRSFRPTKQAAEHFKMMERSVLCLIS